MKKIMLLPFIFSFIGLFGQENNWTEEEVEVYQIIELLFDGMRAGDSSMVHAAFSDDVRMYSNSVDKDGNYQFSEGSLSAFLTAVGTPHEGVWDEKIWNTKVNVEMGVAQVWTDYAFYRDDKFSHCGIDAFQLVNDNGWKIINLIDTRKKMNCEKPK